MGVRSLGNVLKEVAGRIPPFDPFLNTRPPVLVIDEANELKALAKNDPEVRLHHSTLQ